VPQNRLYRNDPEAGSPTSFPTQHRLLAARQELLSSFFGQPKVACKLIYDVADPVLLPVARDLQNWQH
jgi:hypothetical protein